MPSKVSDLVAYLAGALQDHGTPQGKTQLVKLLYLADVENYRWRRQLLSGIPWRFLYYGPYAHAFDEALQELHLDMPETATQTQAGRRVFSYAVPEYLYVRAAQVLAKGEKAVLDRVVGRWGNTELPQLLDYVYFQTEPMEGAQRGGTLDFEKIAIDSFKDRALNSGRFEPGRRPPPPRGLSSEVIGQFREKALAAMARTREGQGLRTQPRFDAVYELAVQRLRQEEASRVPEGDVELDDEVKGRLAEGRD